MGERSGDHGAFGDGGGSGDAGRHGGMLGVVDFCICGLTELLFLVVGKIVD